MYTDSYFDGTMCRQTGGAIGYAKSYSDSIGSHRTGYYGRYAQELLDLMRRQGVPLRRMLDVGCGYGAFLNVLRSRDHSNELEVHGVELDPAVCEKASKNLSGAPVYCGGLRPERMTVPREYFDAVSLLDVIEHLDDPRDYLARLAECATPDGFLLVTTPNIGSFNARIYGHKWILHSPPLHVYYFGLRSLGLILSQTGWEVRHLRTEGTVFHNERHGMETWRGKLARVLFQNRLGDLLNNRLLRSGSIVVAIAQKSQPRRQSGQVDGNRRAVVRPSEPPRATDEALDRIVDDVHAPVTSGARQRTSNEC